MIFSPFSIEKAYLLDQRAFMIYMYRNKSEEIFFEKMSPIGANSGWVLL